MHKHLSLCTYLKKNTGDNPLRKKNGRTTYFLGATPMLLDGLYLVYGVCVCVYSGLQHLLSDVFVLFVFDLLVISLDCLLLIVPSVFSNVYFKTPC